MRFRMVFAGVLSVLVLMFAAMSVSAASGAAVSSFTAGCQYFLVTYADGTFDRDNTGTGEEAYEIKITDGSGSVIFDAYQFTTTGRFTIPAGTEPFVYMSAPVANPIHLTLISLAGNSFPAQTIWDLTGNCPDLQSAGDSAPGIPDGFVLSTIICDVPVYDTPAGSPVGDGHITAGQTWFVNPTPVEGDDGKQWTEIYVSGFYNPFIPTSCVG